MSFYRFYTTQDSYLSSSYLSSNFGADHVFDLSTTSGLSANQNHTRILIQFSDVQSITASLSTAYSAIITLYNARNYKVTDENFTVELYPLTAQWSEGVGSYIYPVRSAVNYLQRTSLLNWSLSGGSYTASPSASCTFIKGTENLTANISSFVEYWKTNPNYGLIIKYPSSIESLTSDYQNNKSFFTGNSHTVYKPHLDINYADDLIIKDDRHNLHIGNNKIFLIDKNVSTTSYPGACYIKADLILTSATGMAMTYFSPNVWYITFLNQNLVWDGLWTILVNTASNYSITSTITGETEYVNFNNDSSRLSVNFIGRQEYNINEQPIFRTKIYTYNHIGMGSVANNYYPTSAFLFFIERNTRKIMSQELEMNYDYSGHFLKYRLLNLLPNFYYTPVVKMIDGISQDVVYREIPEASFYVRKPSDIYA